MSNASILCVDDTIHIFGGQYNQHQFLYDVKAKSISKGVQLCKHELQHAQSVHIPNTSTVYVIGGIYRNDDREDIHSSSMYGVSFQSGSAASRICGKYVMPQPLSEVAALFVHPFILLFGGCNNGSSQNNIYSFDIYKHEWRESCIKIPSFGRYHALLTNDQKTIHLFRKGTPRHYSISLAALLNGQWNQLNVDIMESKECNEDNDKISSKAQIKGAEVKEEDDKEEKEKAQGAKWNCTVCTFLNDASTPICTVCHSASRPSATHSVQQQDANASNREKKSESEFDMLWKAMRNLQDENKAIKVELSATKSRLSAVEAELERIHKEEKKEEKEEERVDELLFFLTDAKYAVNLAEHYETFAEEEVTQFDLLMALNTQDLIDMNITKKGHQLRILRGVAVLKAEKERSAATNASHNDALDEQTDVAAPAAYGGDAEMMVEGPNVVITHRK